MKLTKKQLSASYVTQATASTSLKEQAYPGGITKGDVANHRDYRLDRSSVASPPRQGRVHPISQLQYHLSGKGMKFIPGVHSSHTPKGLKKHSQLKERHPSCMLKKVPNR